MHDGIDARLKPDTLPRVSPGKKHRALYGVVAVAEQCPCRYRPGLQNLDFELSWDSDKRAERVSSCGENAHREGVISERNSPPEKPMHADQPTHKRPNASSEPTKQGASFAGSCVNHQPPRLLDIGNLSGSAWMTESGPAFWFWRMRRTA